MTGYKNHLITTTSGIYVDHTITSMSRHGITFLLDILSAHADYGQALPRLVHRRMLGDRGYDAIHIQQSIFEEIGLNVSAQMKRNQKDYEPDPFSLKLLRKNIETYFAQLTDEFRIKHNQAKRYAGV